MDVRETGKSRSQRINIDYYRQKTWLTKSRGLLALVATIAAVGYCVYVYAAGGSSHVSTGPLAAPHASFEQDCGKCHLDFTPISGDALRFASSSSLDRLESACQSCHKVSQHFRGRMKPEFAKIDQHCSACHNDHQGRDNSMIDIDSDKCTQCHANLAATCSGNSLDIKPTVREFTLQSHGDFSALGQGDPGRVKFDHAQHMAPGQVDDGNRGGFLISMLEPSLRDKYRKASEGVSQGDDALVTLSCADCHQFSGTLAEVAVGDVEIGRHVAPISFDQHCAACHSLNAVGRTEETLPLPHAAPWQEVELLIASKVIGGQQLGEIRMPRDAVRKTPLVGEGNSAAIVKSDLVPLPGSTAKSLVTAAVAAGRAALQTRCLQCHEPQDVSDQGIASSRAKQSEPLIPDRWFKRGIYDHAAHRKIDCKFCHRGAYEPGSADGKANDQEVVMIEGIESCTGCHRPAETGTPSSLTDPTTVALLGGQANWASDKCVECHRYHWERPQPAMNPVREVAMTEMIAP